MPTSTQIFAFATIFLAVGEFTTAKINNGVRNQGALLTQGGEDPDPIIRERRDFVKQMMVDAWTDYVAKAWGENELKPISEIGQPGNHFGGAKVGCTIVDSLDTLYIMELMDEFNVARDFVRDELDFSTVNATISQFEGNIRFVGGLLGAYALSGEMVFLDKAKQLVDLMLPVFDTPTGLPYRYINILSGEPNRTNTRNYLAEIGTLHLEYTYLSHLTNDSTYAQIVNRIQVFLDDAQKLNGLYPSEVDILTGEWTTDYITIGPPTDSVLEYFLKTYILTNKSDTTALRLYHDSIDALFENNLVQTSEPSKLKFVAEQVNGTIDPVVHHLACFAGGMLVNAINWDDNHPQPDRDLELAINFTNTCYESYLRSNAKLGPARFRFSESEEADGSNEEERDWKLRPELIESFVILYRLTGDSKYRDWGWEIAQTIQELCKAGPGRGYSGIVDVYADTPMQDDVQQTYFLAEVLKYLYLLFSTPDLMDLNYWVFNTEAHAFPILN